MACEAFVIGTPLVLLMSGGIIFLVLLVGCSKVEMAAMDKKTGEDAVTMVQRYKEASVAEVETVLKEYLVLANEYERRGWGQYGSPGWIENLRGLIEARLAVFHDALGRADLYGTHMQRALAHFKRADPKPDYTEAGVRELIERLDVGNIQPRWRNMIRQPIRSETNSTSPPAGSRR
jgi:hypothetical protein